LVKKPELKWGETPWDDMPREDLVRETARLFSALEAARGVAHMARLSDPSSLFWSVEGTGGRALAMADAALKPYEQSERQRENIYRAYFRTAVDLLFAGVAGVPVGWHICDACETMVGRGREREPPSECFDCARKCHPGRPMRPITWDDLRPRREH
jgi:hypothetical protein